MPTSPLQLCTVSGCPNLVGYGKCDTHRLEARRDSDRTRPDATQRGYNHQWRQTRRAYLEQHPLCECDDCQRLPTWQRPTAVDVDHIDGLGPAGPRGHDWSNLQALTHAHHTAKTNKYDGGFGRRTT